MTAPDGSNMQPKRAAQYNDYGRGGAPPVGPLALAEAEAEARAYLAYALGTWRWPARLTGQTAPLKRVEWADGEAREGTENVRLLTCGPLQCSSKREDLMPTIFAARPSWERKRVALGGGGTGRAGFSLQPAPADS